LIVTSVFDNIFDEIHDVISRDCMAVEDIHQGRNR